MSCDPVSQALEFQLRGTVGSRHDGGRRKSGFAVFNSWVEIEKKNGAERKSHKWTSLGEEIRFYESELTDDLDNTVVRTDEKSHFRRVL